MLTQHPRGAEDGMARERDFASGREHPRRGTLRQLPAPARRRSSRNDSFRGQSAASLCPAAAARRSRPPRDFPRRLAPRRRPRRAVEGSSTVAEIHIDLAQHEGPGRLRCLHIFSQRSSMLCTMVAASVGERLDRQGDDGVVLLFFLLGSEPSEDEFPGPIDFEIIAPMHRLAFFTHVRKGELAADPRVDLDPPNVERAYSRDGLRRPGPHLDGSSHASNTRSADALNSWTVFASTVSGHAFFLGKRGLALRLFGRQKIIDGLKPARPEGLLSCDPLLGL